MRHKLVIAIGLLAVFHAVSSEENSDTRDNLDPENKNGPALVADSITNLAHRISLAISNPKSKTEIFSPVSIAGALSLLLLGSGGTTKDELMALFDFQNKPINFTDIHKSFGLLFRELVSNAGSLQNNVPWRENDSCTIVDEDEEDEIYLKPEYSKPKRQKRNTDKPTPFDRYSHEVQLANGIFLDSNFNLNQQYVKTAERIYQSEVERLSFSTQPDEATNHINRWINENTHGKIPEIYSTSVGSNTAMVIASAMYFKALWEEMFIKGATRPRDFFPDGRKNDAIQVEMMAHGGCFPHYESEELDATILGIPYKNNLTTMYVIKPNHSSRQVLQELIAKLNHVAINDMISRMRKKTAVILFPKMHISNTLNLKRTLKILGVRSMFQPSKSDLAGIAGNAAVMNYRPISRPAVPQVTKPAVNLPQYNRSKPKPGLYQNQLVFSRIDNENTTIAPESETTPVEETTATEEETSPTTSASTSEPSLETQRPKRDVSYKTPAESKGVPEPLKSKDFFLNKRIVKPTAGKKSHRSRRETEALFVSDAIHKIDLEINERGTEGGAATAITLNRSGTTVVFRADEPFLLLIRNDKTKLPLFFGAVYDPTK